ncbi:GNAT family N-acetyltransferase [Sphingomonas sp.]|uniref:GNAT family N-acetyltransferase n=1 Tax=Sphingomonas sp. TaxID=28214 RepID=UPI003CC6D715
MAVTDNRAEHRYELPTEAGPAVIVYALDGDTMTMLHTVVPPEAGGHGIGTRLVEGALTDARARGLKVVPQCAFVAAYLAKHPDAAKVA